MATGSASAAPVDASAVSFGKRVSDLARDHPDSPAFTFAQSDGTDRTVTRLELEQLSNRAAHVLAAQGIGKDSLVVLALPNSVAHVVATLAAWKRGACVLPLRADMPPWERERVLQVAKPTLVIGSWTTGACPVIDPDVLADRGAPDTPLPDVVARPARAIATSGSTGTPKIIVVAEPGVARPDQNMNESGAFMGQRAGRVQLIPAPMYHANGFFVLHGALFQGQAIVLMEKFDAARAVGLIERYRINYVTAVTIMLQRMARLPGIAARDLSSIECLLHGGAPLPQWLARFWIDRVGAEHFFVAYGSSENAGNANARGDEWLAHPGTVGRPTNTEVRILDDEGHDVPTGEIGGIWLRRPGQQAPAFDYLGDVDADIRPDLFATLGDLGWVDDDGYLFVADRRKDMIITGGANVFPAEVEAALSEDPAVADVVVVGRPDDEWGQRVHAIVQPVDVASPPSTDALRERCKTRLATYKVPKSYEFVAQLPRTTAGKVRRGDLRDG